MTTAHRRRNPLVALCAVALASAGTGSAVAAYSYFYTGQTGAQVQVDVNHTQYWTVNPISNLTNFIGGRFKMKAGPHTVENVTFVFFAGSFQDYLDNTYTALLSVTKTPADVGTADFSFIDFFAPSPVTMTAGTAYTGVIFSNAPDKQSEAYFIKDSFEFIAQESPAGIVPTPSAALFGAAGTLLCLGRRRR